MLGVSLNVRARLSVQLARACSVRRGYMLSVDTPSGGSLVRGCVIFLFVGGKWGKILHRIPKLVSRLLENYSEISPILLYVLRYTPCLDPHTSICVETENLLQNTVYVLSPPPYTSAANLFFLALLPAVK